ncbi:crotonase/enoyl-CoA hydratase family protein [Mycobacterium sp. CVI_P3]|uniref:Crotonase/enoyl-CoA hydratase family protein n=1 Tax=Mycobacterium pinniadriaticum TaxID=2994102 RepID=A0ABT3SAS0_9MYCO|nr:crotonase/enoyl-CoA hydratase family protein [Mycobacterium pinniadriaticum]MCX2930102.1 crotonase/enoyl-CoA hydratase family protein [Mycobacterium pinniadriaticum]MCX2936249.1 crotonase/enoyl-CoA hydratase family protein [Mycobacterium pinniadriaticum]
MTSGVDTFLEGNVGVLAINRPAVRNAIDLPTAEQIAAALDDFETRSEIRAIVITGRGGFFSAGMDLKALTATNQRPITASRGAFGVVEKPPAKPMIAAVEGAALGGGLEIAMAADLIVVAENARLGLPEVARGLVATAGGVLRLPSRVPRAAALEMIMTGAPISAERAYQIGLVNQVVPEGGALASAVELAQTIAANAPMAVRAAKAVALNAQRWEGSDGFMLQRRYTDPVRESADAAEGARAFVEKRPPVWQDA